MIYRLTPSQSLAWHSDDAEERETVRAEIRRAALARLGPHSEAARIVDAGGELLEELATSSPVPGQ